MPWEVEMSRILFVTVLVLAGISAKSPPAFAASYAGAVSADGHKQVNTSKYSVSHPSAGRYILTFGTSFTPYPTCVFMPLAPVRASGLIESGTKCDVTFVSLSSGALTNTLFNFIAISTTH
jgi:hypothetical protein